VIENNWSLNLKIIKRRKKSFYNGSTEITFKESRIVLTRSLNMNWLCLWRLESKLAENFKMKGLRVKQEWSRGEGEELHIYTFYWVFEVYKQFPFCSTFNIRNESSYLHFKDLRKINQGWPFEFIFMTTLYYFKMCCHFHRSLKINKTLIIPRRLPSSVTRNHENCQRTFVRNVHTFLSSTWRHNLEDGKLSRYGLYNLTPRDVIPLWRISWTILLYTTSWNAVYI